MSGLRPLYNCTVQLNGSRDNCVALSDVTAAEIKLLQFIHGRSENSAPPVVNVQDAGRAVNRPDTIERARLAQQYRAGELNGQKLVDQVFGVGTPLPAQYEEAVIVDPAEYAEEVEEIVTIAPAKPGMTEVQKERVEQMAAGRAAKKAAQAKEAASAVIDTAAVENAA